MDTRRMLTAICFAMSAVIAWQLFVQYLAQKNHWTVTTQPTQTIQTVPASATAPAEMSAAPAPATPSIGAASQPALAGNYHISAAAATTQPAVISIGSGVRNDPTYSIGITLSPRGASVQSVFLNQFKQDVNAKSAYTYEEPLEYNGITIAALATDTVRLNDKAFDLSSVDWHVLSHTPSAATFAVDITDAANKPFARVEKTFQVFPDNDRREGYESHVTERVINLSPRALTVRTMLNGTLPPVRELESSDDRQIIAGYPSENTIEPGHWLMNDYVKTPTMRLVVNDKGQPMRWFGASSVYFMALVRPEPAPRGTVSMPVADAEAQALNADAPNDQERLVSTTLTTADVTLKPSATAELPLSVFFGPKKRDVITNAYYSAPPLCYNAAFRTISRGYCGFCAFQPLVTVLVDMLRGFHFVFRDWGLAIICLVIVVKIVLHPISRSSQVSMQKMQKMGPEMERLKTKYKDQPDELQKAMMVFYKEQGLGPVLGCLPMFLQTPIWIALWDALQNTFELRHAPFLYNLTWIHDLSKPDSIYNFAGAGLPIPILGWHIHSINLLPILMGVIMYGQQKMMPRPATVTPEQASQQKLMAVLSTLMFPLMLYTGPSGLNLYILTSSAFSIWESKIIRDHLKQREEAEKSGQIIVEGTRKMRRTDGEGPSSMFAKLKPKNPSGGIAGWFAKMQTMAEEVRREQEKKNKKK